jgi:beta-N-acetylhexosaminidase
MAYRVYRRRTGQRVAALVVFCLVAGGATLVVAAARGGDGPARPQGPPQPLAPLGRLVGQRLMVAMRGTRARPWLMARVRAGQVGGVILFGRNVSSPAQVRALTGSLQAAARAGGQPPLLIATDQEGGAVKRLPWAPPAGTPAQMAAAGPAATRSAGIATGRALRALGIDADLAPVVDVPASPASFIARQGRDWSFAAATTASTASAFAAGLAGAGVAATAKHFPGLGLARTSTDSAAVTIAAPRGRLAAGLAPFRSAVRAGVAMVMLSTARYPALATRPAAWSPRIIGRMLRAQLGFRGVAITDSLTAAAAVHHMPVASAALLAAGAGADIVLVTGAATASAHVYDRMLAAARSGALPVSALNASYRRIVALKRRVGHTGQPSSGRS